MRTRQEHRFRRLLARIFWALNGLALRVPARLAPWWVVLETVGRSSGRARRVPLARGPQEGDTTWVIAVHGREAGFVKNLLAEPRVRIRLRGSWRDAIATVEPLDDARLRSFNPYARLGPLTLGIDPVLVRLQLDPRSTG